MIRISFFVQIGIVLIGIIAGAMPALAGSRPCAATEPVKSKVLNATSAITITNQRSTPLTLEQLNPSGAVATLAALAPGESKLLQIERSEPVISFDVRRRCLSMFVSEKEAETWAISTALEDDYETRTAGPFRVYIAPEFARHDRLLLERCLQVLESDASRLEKVLPSAALGKISGVPIWLEYEPDKSYGGIYFDSEEWLDANGISRAKAKSIQFTSSLAAMMGSEQNPLLHELAHAYHDLVLSQSYAPVRSAYLHAQVSGLYNAVRHSSGRWERAYAMRDYREFFAELSEAYFGTNDFYPFTRGDLKKFDPSGYKVISDAWERPLENAKMPTSPTTGRLIFLIVAILIADPRQLMAQSPNLHPSPMPQNETIIRDDASFVAECRSRIESDVKEYKWVLGNSILTQSEEFGIVWRTDFETPGKYAEKLGLVDRIICWRRPGSDGIEAAFLFGTAVPKLE